MLTGNKADLRHFYRQRRNDLTPADHEHYSQQICQQIISFIPAHQPLSIHLFLAIEHHREVDLTPLIPLLWEQQHRLYVPRVTGNRLEHVRLLPETTLRKNHYGIPEPSPEHLAVSYETLQHIDIILTPLLVADKTGNRVGYGGGFYDRFFQEFPKAQRIGLGFFPPINAIQDCYEGDIPLDYYITPEKIFAFENRKMVR